LNNAYGALAGLATVGPNRRASIKALAVWLCLILSAVSAKAELRAVYNQLGYLPGSSKVIRLLSDTESKPLKWQGTSGSQTLKGESSTFVYDEMASLWVSTIDLSEVKREGSLKVGFSDQTVDLVISGSVYDGLLQQLLRSYYLQRCGVALDDQLTQLRHAVCHAEDGKVSVKNDIEQAGVA